MRRTRLLCYATALGCVGALTALADVGSAAAARPANAAGDGQSTAARPTVPLPFYPEDWLDVASGGQTSCGISTDTYLWCWGDNEQGQMGIGKHGHSASTSAPYQVAKPSTWTLVSVGGQHTCGIQTDGSLWCWGADKYGQLGIGSTKLHDVPQQVGSLTDWTSVSAGTDHTCAIQSGGSLWCWGRNDDGQLGLGSTQGSGVPEQVAGSDWASVSAGGDHTCATQSDASLWCWGTNAHGELGLGSAGQQTSPVQVGSGSWSQVSSGITHTCAIGADSAKGTVWCWGKSGAGRSSTPKQVGKSTAWAQVSAGDADTCGTQTDGTVWCWGKNHHGQLGQGNTKRQKQPMAITFRTGWQSVVEGGSTTCAIRDDTTLWCWGYNSFGQLGDHAREDRYLPTTVNFSTKWTDVSTSGGNHTCAISGVIHEVGWLFCWGVNGDGQLGDGTTTDQTLPEHIGSAAWTQVAGGEAFTCGVQTNGTLWCWGANDQGQLGDGSTQSSNSPVQVGSSTDWTSVTAGQDHACATQSGGSLWCWGDNSDGELGDGSTTGTTTPQQVGTSSDDWASVSAGVSHTCAIRADQSLWCWGDNSHGEVGDGTQTQRDTPVSVSGGGDWSSVSAGGSVTCGLRPSGSSTGSLYCWGEDDHGQAGAGGGADVLTPKALGGSDWLEVSVGADHSCGAQTADHDSLWCWGVARDGDLGDGKMSGEEDYPTRMLYQQGDPWVAGFAYDDRTCALKQFLECFGDDSVGQLGDGSPTKARTMPTTIFVIPN